MPKMFRPAKCCGNCQYMETMDDPAAGPYSNSAPAYVCSFKYCGEDVDQLQVCEVFKWADHPDNPEN